MSFQKAIKESVQYLKSDEFKNREDAQDTLKSLPLIIKVNQKGLITFDSQEGIKAQGERAYCIGFMEPDKVAKFIQKFNIKFDKVAIVVTELPENAEYPPRSEDIPLTINKKGKVHTHMSTYIPKEVLEFEKEQRGLKGINVKMILIFDPKWGRKGLWKDILKAL